jgi:hypothetical protein
VAQLSTPVRTVIRRQVGQLAADHVGGKAGQEARLELGPGPVGADLLVGRRGQQQEAVVRDAPARHVGGDDAAGLADGVGEIGAVGADDQRQVGGVQEVEAAADADHPFAVLDVELAVGLRTSATWARLPAASRARSASICCGMSGNRAAGAPGAASVVGGEGGQVEGGAAGPVQDQRVLVGFEAADQRINRGVPAPEHVLHLPLTPNTWAMASV